MLGPLVISAASLLRGGDHCIAHVFKLAIWLGASLWPVPLVANDFAICRRACFTHGCARTVLAILATTLPFIVFARWNPGVPRRWWWLVWWWDCRSVWKLTLPATLLEPLELGLPD